MVPIFRNIYTSFAEIKHVFHRRETAITALFLAVIGSAYYLYRKRQPESTAPKAVPQPAPSIITTEIPHFTFPFSVQPNDFNIPQEPPIIRQTAPEGSWAANILKQFSSTTTEPKTSLPDPAFTNLSNLSPALPETTPINLPNEQAFPPEPLLEGASKMVEIANTQVQMFDSYLGTTTQEEGEDEEKEWTPPKANDLSDSEYWKMARQGWRFVQITGAAIVNVTTYLCQQVGGTWTSEKTAKYEHIMHQLKRSMQSPENKKLYESALCVKDNSVLQQHCEYLHDILENAGHLDVRSQKDLFLQTLRSARRAFKPESSLAQKEWVQFLSLERFTGTKLYGYCKALVANCSIPFEQPIKLENFWGEFSARNKKVSQLKDITAPALAWQKLTGALNIRDFLAESNIPYIYGQLKINDQLLTVLRHGTPVALYWGENYKFRSEITEDYVAFIEAAGAKKQKILHLILENGKHTFEGVRVQLRQDLAKHENFYPLALRLDGDFFKPKEYKALTYHEVTTHLKDLMYQPETGYHVPEKLRQEGLLSQKDLKACMETVKNTFFSHNTSFNTIGEFQAFVMLTYAEVTLHLCQKLEISYLEALCKDDIDRGGAMKAVLVLLHLHKSGLFAKGREQELSQALENLMVNIIAAPLIVKKQAILEDRGLYIKQVIDVLKNARDVPGVYQGSFNVLSEPNQGLTTPTA